MKAIDEIYSFYKKKVSSKQRDIEELVNILIKENILKRNIDKTISSSLLELDKFRLAITPEVSPEGVITEGFTKSTEKKLREIAGWLGMNIKLLVQNFEPPIAWTTTTDSPKLIALNELGFAVSRELDRINAYKTILNHKTALAILCVYQDLPIEPGGIR